MRRGVKQQQAAGSAPHLGVLDPVFGVRVEALRGEREPPLELLALPQRLCGPEQREPLQLRLAREATQSGGGRERRGIVRACHCCRGSSGDRIDRFRSCHARSGGCEPLEHCEQALQSQDVQRREGQAAVGNGALAEAAGRAWGAEGEKGVTAPVPVARSGAPPQRTGPGSRRGSCRRRRSRS